ncbi:MAG: domain containing protein [Bacteroidota bacterium]|nr:domain containing protein [Bacteroidota bacterium]
MFKNLLFTLGLILFYTLGISQTVVASFNSPDTVCKGQTITIINTSQNATTNKWFFCKKTPTATVTGVNLGGVGIPTRPTNIKVIKDGANYIGFVGNNRPGGDQLVKINFGTNLLSVPVATPMGSFGGVLTEPEGMKFVNEGGNWYGIIISNNPSTYLMARLDFGTSLNNIPTITNYGNLSGALYDFMKDLVIEKTAAGYIGFVGLNDGTLVRLNFGASIVNIPTTQNLGNIGPINTNSKMGLIQRHNNWFLFLPSDNATPSSNYIIRADFGNSLLNTPTSVNLGNPGNLLNRAYGFLPFVDCESFKGYVMSPGDNSIIEYTFPNEIESNTITGVKLGNVGGFNFQGGFSNLVSYNGDNYVFSPNTGNNTISRLLLSSSCQSFGVATSTATNPPPFHIDSLGTYNVTLVVNENLASEVRTCKEITVVDSIKKPDAVVNSVCVGDTIRLTVNNIDSTATYAWTGPNAFTATTANVKIPNATAAKAGQYIVTATGRCGVKKDTVNVVLSIVNVNLGRDTAICQGASLLLNATTATATYLWSTSATSPTITVNSPATYSVRVTVNTCIGRDTIIVTQLLKPAAFNLGKDTTYCGSFSRVLSTGVATTSWSTGATGSQITVTQPGTYIATITNNCGSTKDTIALNQISCVVVTPSFNSLDTVCKGQTITITNTSQNATTNKWFFCKETPSATVTGVNLGGTGLPTRPTNIKVMKDGANYIGFVGNNRPGGDQLVKINFGTNLLSIPVATPMGSFGGLLTEPEGMKFINEGGNWYGIIISNNPSTYLMARLDFGTSLNNIPTITNYGNLTGALYDFMKDLVIEKTSVGYIGFIGLNDGTLIRLNFGASIVNIPTTQNLGNIGPINTNSKMGLIQRHNNWFLFLPSDNVTPSSNYIIRADFGNSLLNTPTSVNLGNPGNLLNRAYGFLPFVDCESFKGYVMSPGDNSIIEYTFPNDIESNTITGVKLGNVGGFNFPGGFSNVIPFNGDNYVFSPNTGNNTISRLMLSSTCQSFGVATSTLTNPPPFHIDSVGTYNVTLVLDENLASETRTCKEITVVDSIKKPDAIVNSVCAGDTIKLRVNNIDSTATYTWTGPNAFTATTANVNIPNATTVKAGQYIVTATGRCGVKKDTVNVVLSTVNINLGRDTAICQGASLTLNATTAGATYLWSTSATSPTITVNSAGTYSVRVTVNTCIGRDTIIVTQLNPPVAFTLGNDTSYCGSFTRVLSTGNATTTWSTGTTGAQITVTQPGTYIATITNACGVKKDTIILSQAAGPIVNLGRDTAICQGANITLNATTANATYLWSTAATSPTITVNTPATYSVRVTVNGCIGRDTIMVSQLNPPVAFSLGNDTTYCGPFTRVLSTGNATTTWSTGTTGSQITVNQPGTYIATITNTCGFKKDTIVISQSTPPVVNLGRDTTICRGSSLTLNASTPNATYLWSTGATSASISVNLTGTYTVTVTVNSCSASDAINVTVLDPPASFSLGNDTAYCGSFTRVLSTGNATTTWSTGTTGSQITVNAGGTYTATITNACGVQRDAIIITQFTPPVVSLGADTTICQGASVTLNASTPNATYQWSTGATSPSISVNQTGTYTVTVTVNGCSTSDNIQVTVLDPPSPFNLGTDTTYCGSFIQVLSTGISTTTWSTGTTASTITVNQPGTYIAVISNKCGSETDSITLQQLPLPLVNLGNDTIICNGSIELKITDPNIQSILWSTGEQTTSIPVTDAGIYWVRVTALNNCANSDTILVSDDCTAEIYIPNAFTPNGDGINDVFIPLSNSKFVTIDKMLIFDRWGEQMYEADNFNIEDKKFAWDGTYKGSNAQMDTYVYYIEMSYKQGQKVVTKSYKGTLTLLR